MKQHTKLASLVMLFVAKKYKVLFSRMISVCFSYYLEETILSGVHPLSQRRSVKQVSRKRWYDRDQIGIKDKG